MPCTKSTPFSTKPIRKNKQPDTIFMKLQIVDIILRRPVTVVMLSLMVIGFGLFALSNLKVTLYPSLDIPVVAISTGYRNVSPDDMVALLVEPIEAAVAGIDGIESIESNARKGSAFIRMNLKPGTNARKVELDAREALDRIRNNLPREATPPVIFQFDPENFPVMRLSVEASNRGLDELRNLSIELVEPLLERINGVASADTRGGLQRIVYVDLNPELMAMNRLTTSQVESAIRANNVQIPVGNLVVNRSSYSIRAQSVFVNVAEIEQTVVTMRNGTQPVRISDVARVSDSFEDVTTVEEVNGKNSVTVEIQKQSDANTLEVTNGVLEALPEIIQRLPPGVYINVLSNEGTSIETSINNLAQSAVFALILVVLILILFLGGWRSSSVVAFSIPISMTATFAAMYFMGLTLNFVSITGLALAVGLLVDSSIVVLESIVGKLEEGRPLFKAASEGTKEVIGALWGSTLSTLVVFLPFLFISGMTSVFMRDLAITISLAISFAFLASIILVPVFASRILPKGGFKKVSRMSMLFSILEKYYGRSLQWVLTHKMIAFVFIVGIFYGTWYFNSNIESTFLPSSDAGQINVNVELPPGTNLVRTAEAIKDISEQLRQEPYVQTIVTSIGTSGFRSDSNVGRITLTLTPADDRELTSDQIAVQLRRRFDLAGVRVSIFASGGSAFRFRGGGGGWGGVGNTIRVTLFGQDTEILVGIANRIEEVMMLDTMVVSVNNPTTSGLPEMHYIVDRQRVSRAGSNLSEVANSFKTQARGTQVGFFRTGGREVPIEVRLGEEYRQSLQDLQQFQILQIADQRVPLENLGRFETVEAMSRITRRDRETMMDVSVSVIGAVDAQRDRIIELFENEIVLPDGYRYEFAGTNQDTQQGRSDIFIALLFGLILTYMVMASKFENFRDPFVIMFSIPLAFFGSYLMLYFTGTPWSVPAGLGMIILVGIVINNGIVMVDYIHQYCTREQDNNNYIANLVIAAKRRMRPILLTALTTIGSMIPLALELGSGSETWSPLALTVIGGLAFSAIFTLYVVPVVLVSISKSRRRAAKEYKLHLATIKTQLS
jgi:hydrophobic/amphiphilic exporter-1 (mainly G- bacteria), HAE1 family